MKTRLYVLLAALALVLIATGLFVYLALRDGQAIQWVAAGLNGLTAVLLFCGVVVTLRPKPPGPGGPKEGASPGQGAGTV